MKDSTVGIHPIYRSGFVERWHANPDVYVGDMPATAKRSAPDMALRLSGLEASARFNMGVKMLTGEGNRLHFADRLEAYTYVAQKAPHILGQREWVDALHALGVMADDLGVSTRLIDWFKA